MGYRRKREKNGETSIITALMREHFIKVMPSALCFSVPRKGALLHNLTSVLTESAAKRLCAHHDKGDDEVDAGLGMDVDDVGDGPQDEQFHFKVVLKNPSQKIVIPVAPGSGGRVAAGSFIVTSHAAIRMADDTVRLSSARLTAGPMHDCTQVMDLFDWPGCG